MIKVEVKLYSTLRRRHPHQLRAPIRKLEDARTGEFLQDN